MSIYNSYNRIEIEITSKCNARCPGCSRTYQGETHPGLPVKDFTAENFIKNVPVNAIRGKEIEFCGVFGDPIMHRDLLTIINYINQCDPSFVHIDTNGSIQNPAFWTKLAKSGVSVTFSVDGHRETNHLYRVNTNFDKILENMRAFAFAGGKGSWEYIVFDHNKHELEKARDEAHELGLDFMERRNDRSVDYWTSYIKEKKEGKIVTKKVDIVQSSKTQFQKEAEKREEEKDKNQEVKKVVEKKKEEYHIKCLYLHEKKLFMGFDGRLWPCCWFHDIYNGNGNPDVLDSEAHKITYHKLRELDSVYGVGWNSVFHNSWEDVLGHEYYTKVLPNTFDKDSPNYDSKNAVPKCFKKCKNSGKTRNVEYHMHIKDKEGVLVSDGDPMNPSQSWHK